MKTFSTFLLLVVMGISPHFLLALGDPPAEKPTMELGNPFEDLLDQSDIFSEGSAFFGINYQFLSTRGKRPDRSGFTIPPVGLNFEKRVFYNLGVRASASTNWWTEEKALVRSGDQSFTEKFKYRYYVGGLGATWHFNVNDEIDPYLGMMVNFRLASASCDCQSETNKTFSPDLLIGVRYFLKEKFFVNFEAGRGGTGYLQLGVGFKFD